MEMDMLHSAGNALLIILDPIRMLYLFGGVCMGLALGILPGIGGVAGLALLLPFTYNIDAPAAFAHWSKGTKAEKAGRRLGAVGISLWPPRGEGVDVPGQRRYSVV